uniref:Uncharacterized protein n=1 Tax=Chromera velia CCMP2878 TaxID=1169474 RepID=A0A0G4FJN9_9ALVE|eukprot:Cvel_17335.t1-p1 / transcript=Cvel_17335.t1 / gene=Cvel_17335 / organism=Chromera_velia_CCMP2878 / gene_product=hypothetical protein / transcript_product=hypothetical protein / location=Cvel_scaffold1377:19590-20312(-) / protein_length=241 / sequence_SO=supercontig / SO=protein_coding / is_pseudo=false
MEKPATVNEHRQKEERETDEVETRPLPEKGFDFFPEGKPLKEGTTILFYYHSAGEIQTKERLKAKIENIRTIKGEQHFTLQFMEGALVKKIKDKKGEWREERRELKGSRQDTLTNRDTAREVLEAIYWRVVEEDPAKSATSENIQPFKHKLETTEKRQKGKQEHRIEKEDKDRNRSAMKDYKVKEVIGKRKKEGKVQNSLVCEAYPNEAWWTDAEDCDCPTLVREFEEGPRKKRGDTEIKI